MTTLILVRHGRTDWTDARRLQGQTDIPLNKAGREEVARLRPVVQEWEPQRVIASTALRAAQTAELLTGTASPLDDRLKEAGLGEWEGLTPEEIGEDYARWRRGELIPPGAEPRERVAARVSSALDFAAGAGGVVLVVTHGGIIRVALETLIGLRTAQLVPAEAASLSVVETGTAAGVRLRHYNLTAQQPVRASAE